MSNVPTNKEIDFANKTKGTILQIIAWGQLFVFALFLIGLLLPIYKVEVLGIVKTFGLLMGDEVYPTVGSWLKILCGATAIFGSVAIELVSKKVINAEIDKKRAANIIYGIMIALTFLSGLFIIVITDTFDLAEKMEISSNLITLDIGGVFLIVAVILGCILSWVNGKILAAIHLGTIKIENLTVFSSVTKSNTDTKTPDIEEELRKYQNLLEEGLITQEEFDAKKKQLLGL